jgi:hypothetical protein
VRISRISTVPVPLSGIGRSFKLMV